MTRLRVCLVRFPFAVVLALLTLAFPTSSHAAQVRIDLDRAREGVQDTLTMPEGVDQPIVHGEVIVEGTEGDGVGSHYLALQVQALCNPSNMMDIQSSPMLSACEIPGGTQVSNYIHNGIVAIWRRSATDQVLIGPGKKICLFTFDVTFAMSSSIPEGSSGEVVDLRFRLEDSSYNPWCEIDVNGEMWSFGEGGLYPPIEVTEAVLLRPGMETPLCPTPTPRPLLPRLVIDLDQQTAGIQDSLTVVDGQERLEVSGQVTFEGTPQSYIGGHSIRILVNGTCDSSSPVLLHGPDVNHDHLSIGDLPDEYGISWKNGSTNSFSWTNPMLLSHGRLLSPSGAVSLFKFDLTLDTGNRISDEILFCFEETRNDPSLYMGINGGMYDIGQHTDDPFIQTQNAVIHVNSSGQAPCFTPTPSPTPTVTPRFPSRPITSDIRIRVDLDRDTEGVQDHITLPVVLEHVPIMGQVIIEGASEDYVGACEMTVFVEGTQYGTPNIDQHHNSPGDLSFPEIPALAGPTGGVSDRVFGINIPVSAPVRTLGSDHSSCLVAFNLTADISDLENEQLIIGVERHSSGRHHLTMVNGHYLGFEEGGEFPPIPLTDAYITLCRSDCPSNPGPNPYPTRATPSNQARVYIDLDRDQAGIQDTLFHPGATGGFPISGQVIVQSSTWEVVGANIVRIGVENPSNRGEGMLLWDSDNSRRSLTSCGLDTELTPVGTVDARYLEWANPVPVPVLLSPGEYLCLFSFDLYANLPNHPPEYFKFTFEDMGFYKTQGIVISGIEHSLVKDSNFPPVESSGARVVLSNSEYTPSPTLTLTEIPTESGTSTPSPTITETPTSSPTPTLTPSLAPCADSGYYILTAFGDHIAVGQPPIIGGSVSGAGGAVFLDMEPARDLDGSIDLAILDGMGTVTFVGNPASTPPQDFVFPSSDDFPRGRAVDVEVSRTGQGFWVLTDFGGIYRAGDTKAPGAPALVPGTDTLPLGYDVPYGELRSRGYPNPGGASLRAVGLVVLDVVPADSRADGFLILDSQGAHTSFLGDGTRVLPGTLTSFSPHDPRRLLAVGTGGYNWPFFQGMDIARDIELIPARQDGVVIYDGWGGIHPVPPLDPSSSVYYLHNQDPAHPGTGLTTVGMPYLTIGFDDPDTEQDEADAETYGSDAASIFVDLEFCLTGDGIYTMDRFGAVFAFGSARSSPESVSTPFSGNPYYFPFMWAADLEPLVTGPE